MPSPDVHLPYVYCLLFFSYRKIHIQKTSDFRLKQDKFHLYVALCKTHRKLVDLGHKVMEVLKRNSLKAFPFDIRGNNSILEHSIYPEEKKVILLFSEDQFVAYTVEGIALPSDLWNSEEVEMQTSIS